MRLKILLAGLSGVVCGTITAYFFPRAWMDLALWVIAGILVGLFAASKKEVIWSGIIYGFLLTLSFLISGFQGSTDQLGVFALLCLALGAVGALCGLILAYIGSTLRRA